MNEESKGEIIIYRAEDGKTTLEVSLKEDTVWLDAHQMADLFQRDRTVIVRHIRNIYKTGELLLDSTCAKIAQVARDGKKRVMDFYNLDMIISVGYRVNSLRGTQFRIWATGVLKDHLIKGYSVNEKRLREQNARLVELQKTVNLLGRVVEGRELAGDEAAGLLRVLTDYSYALTLLDQYDHKQLEIRNTSGQGRFIIKYEQAREAIDKLGEQYMAAGQPAALFGIEKDESFQGILGALYQTFGGKELYQSVEEKAAHLLYFAIKDHPFTDGNKRIAAFLFVWFLDANGILYAKDGRKRIGDNALVALSLLIAESDPYEKDIIIKVIVNLINKDN
ncbi:MAG: virulence protein RhuM/Fic/DOC family protein [Desulfobacterales bacterium]|nr:virulence protein RhuM/Fic/DOC family protein [Desulfobacterales bacterium]